MKFVKLVLLALLIGSVANFALSHATPGIREREGRVRGWDFVQFYVASRIVIREGPARLYDKDHFQAVQSSMFPVERPNIKFRPIYPPMTALLTAPWALLPYPAALCLWLAFSLACFIAAVWMLLPLAKSEHRSLLILACAGFFPLAMSLRAGQLSALLLLIVSAGLVVGRTRPFAAGVILSLLAIKPQFAVGYAVWSLLRRDWRVLGGMAAGGLALVLLTAAALGPGVIVDYLRVVPSYAYHSQLFGFPAGWVHSLLEMLGWPAHLAALLIVAGCALATKAGYRERAAQSVIFILILTPHLLTYDLLLLVAPMVLLCDTNGKLSAALLLSTSALATPIYAAANASLVPFVLLTVMVLITARPFREARQRATKADSLPRERVALGSPPDLQPAEVGRSSSH